VLQVKEGTRPPTQEDSSSTCRAIARYKLPRFVTYVDLMQRSPSGKPDYGWATRVLADAAGVPAAT
jgi:acyl-CoA synthetase (AMP-forming)/AMP-acid ligase II